VELFEAFKDAFYPSIYLGSFDECEHDSNAPYWGFEAWHSLVSYHVYPEFSNKGISTSSVTIEEQWGNACRL